MLERLASLEYQPMRVRHRTEGGQGHWCVRQVAACRTQMGGGRGATGNPGLGVRAWGPGSATAPAGKAVREDLRGRQSTLGVSPGGAASDSPLPPPGHPQVSSAKSLALLCLFRQWWLLPPPCSHLLRNSQQVFGFWFFFSLGRNGMRLLVLSPQDSRPV